MISVIVPAYNAEKYLAECLTSILSQSYRDIEVILVNDGSTDCTLSIAQDFANQDSRLKVFTTGNRGVSCARNYGIEHSSGEWIILVDSDDCLHPEALKKLHSAALETDTDIVVGRLSSQFPATSRQHSSISLMTSQQAIETTLYQTGTLTPSTCGVLYCRDIIANQSYTPGTRYEDLDLFYRLYELTDKIAIISDTVYFYRNNTGSFINTFSQARLDALTVTEKIERYMSTHHPALLPAARDRRLSANFNMLALIYRHDQSGEYTSIKQQCWEIIKKYRRESLLNPKVRLKNKIGCFISFFGRNFYCMVSEVFIKGITT